MLSIKIFFTKYKFYNFLKFNSKFIVILMDYLFSRKSKDLLITLAALLISSCSSSGGTSADPISMTVITNPVPTDQRYVFESFQKEAQTPFGAVTLSYGTSAFMPSDEFPSNDKYKIEDFGFLQVVLEGTHPGDDSNQDEVSLPGTWSPNGQWFEAKLNADDFLDLIYVGTSSGSREYVPQNLMITFLNDGQGHFEIAPELFINNSFPCVSGGTNWLNIQNNDPNKECGNAQDYTNGKLVADFNGDGLSDFYDTSILFLSNENGMLINVSKSNLPPLFFQDGHGQIFSHDAAYGDLDGDGDLDIFVPISDFTENGYKFGGQLDECISCNMQIPYTALINDGKGNFTANHKIPLYDYWVEYEQKDGYPMSQLWPTTAAIGDFDGDGYGDIAMGWFNPEIAHLYGFNTNSAGVIYLNNGENDWTQRDFIELPSNYFGSNGNANDMEAFDFNNDGFLDIIFASTTHDPYYQSRVIQFFLNNNGESFVDVTSETNTGYSTYVGGNPFSNYWVGQGKLQIVDYDHDGDLDIIDTTPRTYVLINNDGKFDWYEDFVDVDDDISLWPVEIDGKHHYDFIGSNVTCNQQSCTTNFFQVLDPPNKTLLDEILAKTDIYESAIVASLGAYSHVRRFKAHNQLMYRFSGDSLIYGYKSDNASNLNFFTGRLDGITKGSFVGLYKDFFTSRFGVMITDNYSRQINQNKVFGNMFALMQFKSATIFIEQMLRLDNLRINFGLDFDETTIDSFKEIGLIQSSTFKKNSSVSQNFFFDIGYTFKLREFSGSIELNYAQRNFITPFGFQDNHDFSFSANQRKNYFDGQISLNRGPLYFSINYLEDRSPILNMGFNYRLK